MTRFMYWLLLLFCLSLMTACGKHVAVCMTMEKDGHAGGTVTAGPWGDVLDINVHGPGTLQRIPEEMAYNPCGGPQPPPGGPVT